MMSTTAIGKETSFTNIISLPTFNPCGVVVYQSELYFILIVRILKIFRTLGVNYNSQILCQEQNSCM